MSSVRSGSVIRSSSRRPWLSNRQSSTFSALAENSAKLVPLPSQLAPSGCGAPADRRVSALRDEKKGGKRRNDKVDLGNAAFVQRPYCSGVPDIATAIAGRIGVEDLAPGAGKRHPDAVVPVDLGGEIDHHHAAGAGIASLAQPGEYAAVGIVHHQPFEPGGVAIELVQRREAAIELIEIAHQRLHAAMRRCIEQVPIERAVVAPFVLLGELVAHEQELLARMPEHEGVVGAQAGEALPWAARDPAPDR